LSHNLAIPNLMGDAHNHDIVSSYFHFYLIISD